MDTHGMLAPQENKCSHSGEYQLTKRKGRYRGDLDGDEGIDVSSRLRNFEGDGLCSESIVIEEHGLKSRVLQVNLSLRFNYELNSNSLLNKIIESINNFKIQFLLLNVKNIFASCEERVAFCGPMFPQKQLKSQTIFKTKQNKTNLIKGNKEIMWETGLEKSRCQSKTFMET